ncbi:hypothetical protein HL670_03315 [Serratia plymuthica]|nr:hypothetical protein HL670_03315 [Serratia plymuthica]
MTISRNCCASCCCLASDQCDCVLRPTNSALMIGTSVSTICTSASKTSYDADTHSATRFTVVLMLSSPVTMKRLPSSSSVSDRHVCCLRSQSMKNVWDSSSTITPSKKRNGTGASPPSTNDMSDLSSPSHLRAISSGKLASRRIAISGLRIVPSTIPPFSDQ